MNPLYVYTAVVGGFNDSLSPIHIPSDPFGRPVRFVCFSDSVDRCPPGWEIRPLLIKGRNARLTARWHKIMSHRVLPEASITLWHDGSHSLKVNPWHVADRCLSRSHTFASFKHPIRNCIYQEVQACVKLRKDAPERLWKQAERYQREGYPAHFGLLETSCIARLGSPAVHQLNESWWQQLDFWSCRDQVSLPYVIWRSGFRHLGAIPGCRDNSPFFTFRPHR
jgi:alkaline ceramidase TOD1/glycosyltransferase MUCI70-like protein